MSPLYFPKGAAEQGLLFTFLEISKVLAFSTHNISRSMEGAFPKRLLAPPIFHTFWPPALFQAPHRVSNKVHYAYLNLLNEFLISADLLFLIWLKQKFDLHQYWTEIVSNRHQFETLKSLMYFTRATKLGLLQIAPFKFLEISKVLAFNIPSRSMEGPFQKFISAPDILQLLLPLLYLRHITECQIRCVTHT